MNRDGGWHRCALDAARYADTNGYQTDAERYMWRWRDWVIDAFNRNFSFDQFALQQIAGDMLPRPTLDQKIANGLVATIAATAKAASFPRNTPSNTSSIEWRPHQLC